MRTKKRFILKAFVVLLSILLGVISSKTTFGIMQDEQRMASNYEIRKEKCELLRGIAKESIQEGIEIYTRKIPKDEVQYNIYNDNENIIFYYYLKGDSTTEPRYNAKITLSDEYKILEEEYSIKTESLEEYIKNCTLDNRMLSIICGMAIVFVFYIFIYFLLEIYKRNKSRIKKYLLRDKDEINFLGNRWYVIHGCRDNEYILTAKELHERIMEDSKSDYNWIAPARELVRICRKTNFPSEYVLDIKATILNCFSNLEHIANCGGDRYKDDPADEEAIQYCYNSLYGIKSKEAIMARKRFLTEMINIASHVSFRSPLYHPGSTFKHIRECWRKSKFEEYISQEKIDFKQLVESLRKNFAEIIKKADADGVFLEDERKDKESWKMFYDMIENI